VDRVSSQLTILIRIALPTMWIVTLVSLVVLLTYSVQGKAHIFSNPILWIILIFIFGSTVLFIKYILWRIFRIDMDERHLYVSDYFKTFKYPFTDIESITDSKVLPGRIYKITLKSKGTFGKEISFLASRKLWDDFVAEHPQIFNEILHKVNSAN
jgi:hypothetical protein